MNTVQDLRRRGVIFWVGLAVVLVAVALLAGRPNRGGPPLDPTSSGPLGTKGLVLLLRELGADVEVQDHAAPITSGTTSTAALLADTLTTAQRRELNDWVEAGGTLLITDPLSSLSPVRPGEPFGVDPLGVDEGPMLERGRRCAIDALGEVGRIQPPAGVPLSPTGDGVGCFPVDDGSFVVAAERGEGTVVVVGGAATFINEAIGDADNAALAASILAPNPGGRVTIMRAGPIGAGQKSLGDLIASRVKGAGWQLVIAFILFAIWRGRRLGRPVHDPQPVEIPGSELVVAVGHLLQRGHHRERAAGLLAADVRRTLCERLGAPVTTPDEVLAQMTAARTDLDASEVSALLAGQPQADDSLIRFAQQTEQLRQEVIHAR